MEKSEFLYFTSDLNAYKCLIMKSPYNFHDLDIWMFFEWIIVWIYCYQHLVEVAWCHSIPSTFNIFPTFIINFAN